MGTQGVHMKEILPWLVCWACRCKYKRFLSCLGCFRRPSTKYFFPHRTILAGSRAASPVSLYVSLCAKKSFPGCILEHMFSVQDSWWKIFRIQYCMVWWKPQGVDPPPLPLHVATAGKNHLNKEITPLLPTGIAERCCQTITNFGHAKLLRRCELPPTNGSANSGGPLVNSLLWGGDSMPNHQGLYCSDVSHQRVHSVAIANFWRTFHHDGKISPAELIFPSGEGGGCTVHPPPFIRFTITYKVAVYAPTERAVTLPVFHLYPYMYSVSLTQDGRKYPWVAPLSVLNYHK
jgi:hypothetical protein